MEAVAVDGGSLVAILIEDPPLVLVIDTDRRQLVAQVTLTAPAGSPLAGQWDDPSSRGEGLVLLRGGRLLVAKEKHPSALVEFSPVGMPSKGLSPDDLLDSGEAWETPAGTVDYAATSMWTLGPDAGDALEDISALAIARDQSLWMLSDKSETVGRLHLDAALSPGTGTIDRFDEVWRLPKRTKKPEGIAALDATRVLVAMDTGSTRHNGLVIERPE